MRLFVAVNPPPHLRQDLDARLDTARRQLPVAWSRPETWHLTLSFLGEWPPQRIPALGDALRAVVGRHGSFLIHPGDLGAFPNRRWPRVLFLHMDGDHPLRDLATDVRRAVNTVWPDGPQDRKNFRPHLTVARIKRPLTGAELIVMHEIDLGAFDAFEVEAVALMASELRPEGAQHTVVESLRLGA